MRSYCVKQKKITECVPGSERYQTTKDGRTMMKCTCAECGITKTKFVRGNQTGGASRSTIRRIQNKGPSAVDKAAYVLSNFVTPAPSFAGLAKILAGQAVKGVTDNIKYYRGGK